MKKISPAAKNILQRNVHFQVAQGYNAVPALGLSKSARKFASYQYAAVTVTNMNTRTITMEFV
jgi:hypothetical protein